MIRINLKYGLLCEQANEQIIRLSNNNNNDNNSYYYVTLYI
jgi:hypothetical protein